MDEISGVMTNENAIELLSKAAFSFKPQAATIELDLKTAIPKMMAALPDLKLGVRRYSAPCIVGSAMTEEARASLKQELLLDNVAVSGLMTAGILKLPLRQAADFKHLQTLFDNCKCTELGNKLKELAIKYKVKLDG